MDKHILRSRILKYIGNTTISLYFTHNKNRNDDEYVKQIKTSGIITKPANNCAQYLMFSVGVSEPETSTSNLIDM